MGANSDGEGGSPWLFAQGNAVFFGFFRGLAGGFNTWGLDLGALIQHLGLKQPARPARLLGNLFRGTATRHGDRWTLRRPHPCMTAAARPRAGALRRHLLTIIAVKVRIVETADRSGCWDQPGEPAPCVSLRSLCVCVCVCV